MGQRSDIIQLSFHGLIVSCITVRRANVNKRYAINSTIPKLMRQKTSSTVTHFGFFLLEGIPLSASEGSFERFLLFFFLLDLLSLSLDWPATALPFEGVVPWLLTKSFAFPPLPLAFDFFLDGPKLSSRCAFDFAAGQCGRLQCEI